MELLEKHFDTAFTASDGIEKLREIILSLAMQGKLVPQTAQDQSAVELLKDIETKKQQLIKEKKLKKYKPLPEIGSDELPYQLPSNWKWCRWNDVALKIGDIDHKMPSEVDKGIPYVSPRDFFGKNEINFESAKKISVEDFEHLRLKIQPEKFDIIFPRYGTLGVNRFVLVDVDFLASYSCAVVKNSNGFIDPRYSYYYSISPLVRAEIERYKKTTTQSNVGVKSIQSFLYPLAPLAEQRRIVAKIDQLMARCDELEKLREVRDRLQIKVHMAACDRLLTAPDTDTFTQSWQFITQHFSELYSVKENVAELRKAILQLAVMGKLVPQDPKNLPASELLDKIKIEKQRLVKEKKIKKHKSFPELKEKDIPYDLPKGWEWTRLVNLAKQIDYGTSQKAGTDSSQIPVYRMGNIVDSQLVNENFKYVSPDIDDLPRLYLRNNDILFNRTNSYELVGKTAIYFGENETTTFASYLIRVRLFEEHLFSSYFSLTMNASYFRKTQIEPEIVQQCGQANFNGTKLSATVIPLPPLDEQQRIVAKVDQLMTLCDTLEQQIDATTQKQTALLNAVTKKI